jgi:hypothetical protein
LSPSPIQLLAEAAVLSDGLDVQHLAAYGGLGMQYSLGVSVRREVRILKAGNGHQHRAP